MATESGDISTDNVSRNLIVDEASFEEQFLRCQVCRDKFDRDKRTPKSLPCNHTFCQPCLKQVFDHGQPSGRPERPVWVEDSREGTLKCPTCRVEIYLSRSEIKKLPSDHRVIQMIDFLSNAISKSQNSCAKHERQPINFFCKTCLVPVCRDCTVLDHKEQQGHVIVDVTDALTESNGEFDGVENKSRELLDKMKQRADGISNALKRLDILERQIKGEIKDTFIEYRLLLERRQDSQVNNLKEMIKQQKEKMTKCFDELNEKGTELQQMYDNFKQARSTNDVRQLFTINQGIKEKEETFKTEAEANDENHFVSYKFAVDNEGAFLAEMSGLGEVTQHKDPNLTEPVPPHQLVLFNLEAQQEMERINASQMPLDCRYMSSPDDLGSQFPSGLTDLNADDDNDEDIIQIDDREEYYRPLLNARRLTRLIETEYPHFNDADSSEDISNTTQERRSNRRGEPFQDTDYLALPTSPDVYSSSRRRSRRSDRDTTLPQGMLATPDPPREAGRSNQSRQNRSSSSGGRSCSGSRSNSSRVHDMTTAFENLLQSTRARVTQDEPRE